MLPHPTLVSHARLPPSTQLNALDVPPPPSAAKWSARALVDLFCATILHSLDRDELRTYLARYQRGPRAPLLRIADFKCGVLSADRHFDCGTDEMPLLDRHFGVSTVVYFSAGQGTFVACDAIQPGSDGIHRPLPLPSHSAKAVVGTVHLVIGDAHYGALLPRASLAPGRASATAWPPASPPFVELFVPSYLAASRCRGRAAPLERPETPRTVRQGGGEPLPPATPPPPSSPERPTHSLTQRLLAGGLAPPTPSIVQEFLALPLVDAVSTLLQVLRGDVGLASSLRTVGASMCKGLDAKLLDAAIVAEPASNSLLSELRTALSTALTAPDLQQSPSNASKAFVMAAQQLRGDIDDALQAISIRCGRMVNAGPSGAQTASHVDQVTHTDADGDSAGNDWYDDWDGGWEDSVGDAVAEGNVGRETSGEAGVASQGAQGGTVAAAGSTSHFEAPVSVSLQIRGRPTVRPIYVRVKLRVVRAPCTICLRRTVRCRAKEEPKEEEVEPKEEAQMRSLGKTCRVSGGASCRFNGLLTLTVPERGTVVDLLLPGRRVTRPQGGGTQVAATSRASMRCAAGLKCGSEQGVRASKSEQDASASAAAAAATAAAAASGSFADDADDRLAALSDRAQIVFRACRAAHGASPTAVPSPAAPAPAAPAPAAPLPAASAPAASAPAAPASGPAVQGRQPAPAVPAQAAPAPVPPALAPPALAAGSCSLCRRPFGEKSKSKCSGIGTHKCVQAFATRARELGLLRSTSSTESFGASGDSPSPASFSTVLPTVLDGYPHILLFGEPGTGKSHLLTLLASCRLDELPRRRVAVVAVYGVVALNVGGWTLASWGGLGHDEVLFSQEGGKSLDASALLARIQLNAGALARWRTVTWLALDEASLLSCELFDVLEEVARRIRGTDAFFGGIRFIMAFDFYQLFSVSTRAMPRTPLFMSRSWDSLVGGALCVELIEQHRFANDERLRQLCSAARHNSIQPDQDTLLRMLSRPLAQHLQNVAVTLAPHRDTVRKRNEAALNALPGEPRAFPMHSMDLGPQPAKKAKLCMSVSAPLGDELLVLKVDSLVMSPVNRRDVGLANGSVGRVTRFTQPTVPSPYAELPVVLWERGIGNREPFEETVTWLPVEPYDGDPQSVDVCLPLLLAHAMTIHKAVGSNLVAVELDVSRDCFAHGQLYEALSRVETLEHLCVVGWSSLTLDRSLADESAEIMSALQRTMQRLHRAAVECSGRAAHLCQLLGFAPHPMSGAPPAAAARAPAGSTAGAPPATAAPAPAGSSGSAISGNWEADGVPVDTAPLDDAQPESAAAEEVAGGSEFEFGDVELEEGPAANAAAAAAKAAEEAAAAKAAEEAAAAKAAEEAAAAKAAEEAAAAKAAEEAAAAKAAEEAAAAQAAEEAAAAKAAEEAAAKQPNPAAGSAQTPLLAILMLQHGDFDETLAEMWSQYINVSTG